jgi:hypothetical protein
MARARLRGDDPDVVGAGGASPYTRPRFPSHGPESVRAREGESEIPYEAKPEPGRIGES